MSLGFGVVNPVELRNVYVFIYNQCETGPPNTGSNLHHMEATYITSISSAALALEIQESLAQYKSPPQPI